MHLKIYSAPPDESRNPTVPFALKRGIALTLSLQLALLR
jgi:hypothetical protein